MVPISHLPAKRHSDEIIGQKVLMLNLQTNKYTDLIILNGSDTSFRPVGIAFNQNEGALYVASIGKVEV